MKPLLTLIFLLTIFLLPDFVLAQAPTITDSTLAPNTGFIVCEGATCTACSALVLANTVIKWLIGITFMFFAVLAVIAGFKLVISGGKNAGALEDAKKSFTNAFIGLFIILGAWLLVDTLLRGVLEVGADGVKGEIQGYGPWSQVTCAEQTEPTEAVDGGLVIDEAEFQEFIAAGGEETGVSSSPAGTNCPAATSDKVVTIPGTSFKALPEIANKFVAMRTAAAADGITLTVRSGWRPEGNQITLFNRLCPSGTCGRVKAARPCSMGGGGSNHNGGKAIDISVGCRNGVVNCNTSTYRWLKANGGRFGFYNNLPSDPPHWSPTGR